MVDTLDDRTARNLEGPTGSAGVTVTSVNGAIDGRQQDKILNPPILQGPRMQLRCQTSRRAAADLGRRGSNGTARAGQSQGCEGARIIGLHVDHIGRTGLMGGNRETGKTMAMVLVELILLLLRSDKSRKQEKGDAGGKTRTGARQPPPHCWTTIEGREGNGGGDGHSSE